MSTGRLGRPAEVMLGTRLRSSVPLGEEILLEHSQELSLERVAEAAFLRFFERQKSLSLLTSSRSDAGKKVTIECSFG